MKSKPTICEACQQHQSDTCWLVGIIGFFAGCIVTGIAAWIIVGIFNL